MILAALSSCVYAPAGERESLSSSDIGLVRLRQPPNPPDLRAQSDADVGAVSAELTAERLERAAERSGSRRVPGVQVPFFFEADLGRAYLKTPGPRALAFGDPAETCPAVGAALVTGSLSGAVEGALQACLAQLGTRRDCGCRLAAANDVILAPPAILDHARAVSVVLRLGGAETVLIAEEPPLEPQDGAIELSIAGAQVALQAQNLVLRDSRGVVGALTLSADGAARYQTSDGERWAGRWRSEGLRRGWFARQIGLRREGDGATASMLVAYEPAELSRRSAALFAGAEDLL